MQGQGSRASPRGKPTTPIWRRVASVCVLGLAAWVCCSGTAHADTARVTVVSSASPTTPSRSQESPKGWSAAASAAAAQPADHGLQRWGLRLVALGIGAGVGWALLRLGRHAHPGAADPVDRRPLEPGPTRRLSTRYPLTHRSGSPPRAR